MKSEGKPTRSREGAQLRLAGVPERGDSFRTILVPIVTGDECEKAFMISCLKGSGEIVALNVIDPNMKGSELEASLKKTREAMDHMRDFFHGMRVSFRAVEEWGDLAEKVRSLAQRFGVDAVVMPKKAEKWAPDFGVKTEFV